MLVSVKILTLAHLSQYPRGPDITLTIDVRDHLKSSTLFQSIAHYITSHRWRREGFW